MSTLKQILEFCKTVKNNRTLNSTFEHLKEEVDELENEIIAKVAGFDEGEDGVLGEVVDVVLCAVDIAYQYNNDITEEEINQIVMRKLLKWKKLYSKED